MRVMHGRRPRTCDVVVVGVLLACAAVWCPPAFALNPALDVSQYAHTAWKIRDGFVTGPIRSIAQTPDGYLWLGTEFGLVRFDGIRTVTWNPPHDQHLPSNEIFRLLVGRDGTLWIGTRQGLASWNSGKLTEYPQLAGQAIGGLLEDREGAVWAGGISSRTARLCVIREANVRCVGDDGSLGQGVAGLFEDRKGNVWVGVLNGLWRWKPGPGEFFSVPGIPDGVQGFAQEDDGTLLFSMRDGLGRLVNGKPELVYRLPVPASVQGPFRTLRDRDGGLWIATPTGGIVHVHQGRTDVFGSSNGLSGSYAMSLFEDREGSIWVITTDGLDRFREFAVATFSMKQGLSGDYVGSVLAARDGSMWLGTAGGLNRWTDGRVTAEGPRQGVSSIFQDERGRVWASTADAVGYLERDRFTRLAGMTGGIVRAIVETTPEDLWIANVAEGLVHAHRGTVSERVAWATLGFRDFATALAADPRRGGLWLGFSEGGVAYFQDGQIQETYAAAALGGGRVNSFRFDTEGAIWIAAAGGLSRLKNGRVVALNGNGLPCEGVHWTIEDNAHAVWLKMPCGLVHIASAEWKRWTLRLDQPNDPAAGLPATAFDVSDGVRSVSSGGYSPLVAKGSDGRLWFAQIDGAGVIDPSHLPINTLAPPVHIEQLTADRTVHDVTSAASQPVNLPALTRDLEIDYTALSLVAPEKNRFRYLLEGYDRDWQDVGTRRQAFYNNLRPRNYRFHVIASNNSGVWNETGASLDFTILPAYYQTTWFAGLSIAATLMLLLALYRWRVRQVAYAYESRLQERVNERTRIARELHDTLLQSFHGLLFRFQAAANLLPDRPAEAKQKFESAIDQAAQAITEGRDAVQNLRASSLDTHDLAVAIGTLGNELAAGQAAAGGAHAPVVDVAVEGSPRPLHPILRDDIYRIAGEALRNAFRHAHARHIEVEIRYDDAQLQIRVRDDGKGIDPAVIEGHRAGHFGLPGMRERAEVVGGHLNVWSQTGLGTEIELTIPAAAAYATPRSRGSSWWFARRSGTPS
jgi:signal transduction histidine kinase/ligand-binding sensor domain-containing protein